MILPQVIDKEQPVNIVLWILFGALAGWIASKINGTDSQQGWIGNIVLGIVGAFVDGFVYTLISGDDFNSSFSIGSLIVAIVGALIFSWALGLITGRKAV